MTIGNCFNPMSSFEINFFFLYELGDGYKRQAYSAKFMCIQRGEIVLQPVYNQ